MSSKGRPSSIKEERALAGTDHSLHALVSMRPDGGAGAHVAMTARSGDRSTRVGRVQAGMGSAPTTRSVHGNGPACLQLHLYGR